MDSQYDPGASRGGQEESMVHISHIVTHACQFWVVVRGTVVPHVGVMGVPRCTLRSAVPDGRGYIIPLALILTATGDGWDLKSG
jgi:hypothetical protein